jgi:hypothetical protein
VNKIMAGSEQTPKESESSQNEYVLIINKKLRAVGKKLSNIAYIENRVAAGSEINVEQKQILKSKDTYVKLQTELEGIKAQIEKVQPKVLMLESAHIDCLFRREKKPLQKKSPKIRMRSFLKMKENR